MAHETNFKQPGSSKVARALKRITRDNEEGREKAKVRRRDGYCRVPLCGCRRFSLAMHVSHQRHKGMGGNPKGDRSVSSLMVYVCSARHKENRVAIDRGTLRWRALTKLGADGPIAWDVDVDAIGARHLTRGEWFEVAVERSVHVYLPLTDEQREVLNSLALMLL